MKFTPTSFFNAVSNGAAKIIVRNIYVRKVTDLTIALSSESVPWVDVTTKTFSLPSFSTKAELEVGIPTTQKADFEFFDIAWWKANIFNATSSEQIEIKVQAQIGLSESKLATDIIYLFSGYLDKKFIPENSKNTLTVSAYSLDDLLNQIIGENLTTQILDTNGNLFLASLPGITVSDANVTSYPLKTGVHTITYNYNTGAEQVKLDDGEYVSIDGLTGTATLINEDGTQKVEITCASASFSTTENLRGDVIVVNQGDTIPKTWYMDVSVLFLIQKIYSYAGINTVDATDLQFNTYDGRYITSFFESPAQLSISGSVNAMCFDSTNNYLWLSIDSVLYKRSMVDGTYTSLGAIPYSSGYVIKRLWAEKAAAGYIWGIAEDASYNWKVFNINTSTGAVSPWSLSHATPSSLYNESHFALAQNIGTAGYLYYIKSATNNVYYFDLNGHTENDTGITLTLTGRVGSPAFTNGTDYLCQIAIDTQYSKREWVFYSDGWQQTVTMTVNTLTWLYGTYNNYEDKIIGLNASGIQSATFYTGNDTNLTAISGTTKQFKYDSVNHQVVFSNNNTSLHLKAVKLGVITDLGEVTMTSFDTSPQINGEYDMTYDSIKDRYLIICYQSQRLIQFADFSSMYINCEVSGAGSNLRDILNEILLSHLLIGIISNTKQAIVKRRMNDAGLPVTSGNSISITNDNVEELTEENLYSRACAWVSVSNGTITHTYDGSTWDGGYLGTGNKIEISHKYIPDELVKDYAYYIFQFFSSDHYMYNIPLANILPLQMEPLDEAALSVTSNISKTATGIIYGSEITADAQMIFEVLV